MKVVILSAASCSMALALLWHFSNILRYGQYLIQEPYLVILWAKIVMIVSIFGFSLYMLIKYGREK